MNANWRSLSGMVLLVFAAVATSASPVAAQSQGVKGVELLPQFLHPQGAVFTYDLLNQRNRKVGFGYVVVDHNAVLPTDDNPAVPVVGGDFMFLSGWRFTSGDVLWGQISTTTNSGLYDVFLIMSTSRGQLLCFNGELDHRPLNRWPPGVPTVNGELSNCYAPQVVSR